MGLGAEQAAGADSHSRLVLAGGLENLVQGPNSSTTAYQPVPGAGKPLEQQCAAPALLQLKLFRSTHQLEP